MKCGRGNTKKQLSCCVTDPTIWTRGSVQTSISLGISVLLCSQWVINGNSFHHAHQESKNTDQTGHMQSACCLVCHAVACICEADLNQIVHVCS